MLTRGSEMRDIAAEVTASPSLKDFDFRGVALDEVYDALKNLPAGSGTGGRQARGFGLERLLHRKLKQEGLSARPSSRGRGQQIDGSVRINGIYASYECKWHGKPISGPTVTGFQSKVDRLMTGTVGFFISMSGFSEDASDFVGRNHILNTLLIDDRDLDSVFRGGRRLTDMLQVKIEHAAWDGIIFWQDKAVSKALRVNKSSRGLVIVVEGPHDAHLLSTFVDQFAAAIRRRLSVQTLPAYGVSQAHALATAVQKKAKPGTSVLALVDGDDEFEDTLLEVWHETNPGLQVLLADPSLEEWLRDIKGGSRGSDPTWRRLAAQLLQTSSNGPKLTDSEVATLVRNAAFDVDDSE